MNTQRRDILIIAPGCDGTDVGESWSSFQWIDGISKHHNVTVLTQKRHGQQSLREQWSRGETIEWDELPLFHKSERFNSMFKPSYPVFYYQARKWIRNARKRGYRFNLLHQVAPIAPRYPSPGANLGIPLIMGPIAGRLPMPKPFRSATGALPWYTRLRTTDQMRLQFDPLLRKTYANADVVLGVAPYVRDLLSSRLVQNFQIESETGTHRLETFSPKTLPEGGPIRLLYVGRVVRNKGVRELVRAMVNLPKGQFQLDVVGQGEDLSECKRLGTQCGVDSVITFHGQIPRFEVKKFYNNAHIFVFPSFREPSGNVISEALSNALPCVVCDNGGPGYVVTSECGELILPTNSIDFSRNIAGAVQKIARDPEAYSKYSMESLQRLKNLGLWPEKIGRMLKIYEHTIQNHGCEISTANPKGTIPCLEKESY
jgi:glycosyltransferase involved in cell wall biosynthesis